MSLLDWQRRMAADVMRSLGPRGRTACENTDYVRPNDSLTGLERLEIYNRQYWFRLLDSLEEDFPGLRAVLGARAFAGMSKAYLAENPSRSFSLRNLGARLDEWLEANPHWAGANLELALDMVRLEWADIEAFDGTGREPLGPEDLLELGPNLRLELQPHIRLLELRYPVDDLRIRVNQTEQESETASNAVEERAPKAGVRVRKPKSERLFLAVHRVDLDVYYRRLEEREYALLGALRAQSTLGEAINRAMDGASWTGEETSAALERWFGNWARFGWLCGARGT
jgi:hypothetical protein